MFALAIVVVVKCVIVAATFAAHNDSEVLVYLQKYGYLNDNMQMPLSYDDSSNITIAFRNAILLFQEYYQLPGDGALNDITLRQMRKPRCGLPDFPQHALDARKWPKTHITWNFHLADKITIDTAEAAFALWASHSPLTFERQILNPDILISYRNGVHTMQHNRFNGRMCFDSFDGPGNVLGHALYPNGRMDGVSEVHIDQAESWHIYLSKNPTHTQSLFQTLAHEIGHSLGLPHGTRNDSIMFPFALTTVTFPVKLSIEDIVNIQQLYGNREETTTTTTTTTTAIPEMTTIEITTTTTNNNKDSEDYETDLCDLRHVDIVLMLDHRIFVAYERRVWTININDRMYKKPLLVKNFLDYLPDNFTRLQAAYQNPAGDIVLFVNNLIYKINYPSFTLTESWPRNLEDIRLPANAKINAAINTNKGRTFIIYDDNNVGELDECSMRIKRFFTLQTIFPGIPPNIVSAFRYADGSLYFIDEQQQYYKFHEFTKIVTTAGKFDLNVIDIECPRSSILRKLQKLLNRLVRTTDD